MATGARAETRKVTVMTTKYLGDVMEFECD